MKAKRRKESYHLRCGGKPKLTQQLLALEPSLDGFEHLTGWHPKPAINNPCAMYTQQLKLPISVDDFPLLQFALPGVPRPSLSSGHTVIFLLRAKKKHNVPKEPDRPYSPCAYKRKRSSSTCSNAKFQKCTTPSTRSCRFRESKCRFHAERGRPQRPSNPCALSGRCPR